MKCKDNEVQLFEIYNLFSKDTSKEALEQDVLIEKEFIDQRVDFSRIAFKDFRDELVSNHLGYAVEGHDGKEIGDLDEEFERQMYAIKYNGHEGYLDREIGHIVDYEIPVKRQDKESNIKVGLIDLMTETANKVYLINCKRMHSKESLLKTVFEIITKVNLISRKKLIADFTSKKGNTFQYYHTKDDIRPAILIFEGSRQHKELLETNPNSLVASLVYQYKVRVFVVKKQDTYGHYELL
jgi:RNA recognition motif-containing protein